MLLRVSITRLSGCIHQRWYSMGKYDGEPKIQRIALKHRWMMLRVFQKDVEEETHIASGLVFLTPREQNMPVLFT